MSDVKTVFTKGGIRVIQVITSNGPDIHRPQTTFKTEEVFTPCFIQSGNNIYTCKLFSLMAPAERSPVQIDLARHLNGGVFKITYQGANYVAPSLTPLGCMGSGAVFDLKPGEFTSQRKVVEIGNKDEYVEDEISDISADEGSIMLTTKMISERAPGVYINNIPVLNTEYVSDIVMTKKLEIIDEGIVDYFVKVSIPARHSHGVVEVLSTTLMNGVANIRLVKRKGSWEIMNDGDYSVDKSTGFVLAKHEHNSMGVALLDWPRGAVVCPPHFKIKSYENVTRWNITQQFGSDLNTSIGIPGGEYSYRIRFTFGPIWFSQQEINDIKTVPHGNDYKYLYEEDKMKRMVQKNDLKKVHKYGYK